MEFTANEGKCVEIQAENETYLRHAIKTKFITTDDDYIEIMKEYVSNIYQDGDIVSISEKIISICQNRIIRREDITIGIWAKFLSKLACQENRGGYGVGMPINMQYAINKAGLLKIILASIAGGFTKIFGIKGVFYAIAGREVSGHEAYFLPHRSPTSFTTVISWCISSRSFPKASFV